MRCDDSLSVVCVTRHGCRNPECLEARRRYSRRSKKRARSGKTVWVDARPVKRHLLRLLETYSARELVEITGVSHTAINLLRYKEPTVVRPETVQRLLKAELGKGNHALRPAFGARRRLQSLARIGYSPETMVELLRAKGVERQRRWPIDVMNGTIMNVPAQLDRAVREIFKERELIQGPDMRARRHAQRSDWPPPLAWDEKDLDNPLAEPHKYRRYDECTLGCGWFVVPQKMYAQMSMTRRSRWHVRPHHSKGQCRPCRESSVAAMRPAPEPAGDLAGGSGQPLVEELEEAS